MEQILQLLEILKTTPQVALWGLGLFFIWTLLKMASWIGALTLIAKLSITKYFESKENELSLKREELKQSKANEIIEYFEEKSVDSVFSKHLLELLDSIKGKGSYDYIHVRDIENAIMAIKSSKQS